MRLDHETFIEVVRNTPLVSIDLIVRNAAGEVLVGLRVNEPARGTWFVPGGCIRKDERIAQAMARISREELGVDLSARAEFFGAYEHFYDANFAEDEGFGTHYVVLAYQATIPDGAAPAPDHQHSQFRWVRPGELLADEQVHPHTKAYFRPDA